VPSRRRPRNDGERGAIAAAVAAHPREFVGIVMAAVAAVAIFVNALFLQRGPHPAPIFAPRPPPARQVPVAPPHPQQAPVPASQAAEPRTPGQIVADMQRELQRRGFYNGALDGIWGAKTYAAARDFAQAAGVKLDIAPSEELLRAIAGAKTKPTAAAEPARRDQVAEAVAPQPSKRILAIQRALADFGYGQIKPTGILDRDTRAAIENFERSHGLPVDGQVTDRLVRGLAGMTGRTLE
jgi:peptidoglycan hydrolase-like protein with peptidoglycan-binding domain